MRGVKVVEECAFGDCEELEYVECPKLEIIGHSACAYCDSLRSVNLPSAKLADGYTFAKCEALTEAKFGKDLKTVRWGAFSKCRSLESITIPLKIGLITSDIFQECANLKRLYLVDGALLHDTVVALPLEEWRNDMNEILDSIHHILPNARAGEYDNEEDIDDVGEKAIEIREWIARVLDKIIDYKAQHCRILEAASSALQLALPNDIVMNNVIPFLELPLHTFDGEEEYEENIDDSDDGIEYI